MIKMPIRVDENGDVTEYWSVAEIEAKLEPIDVRNNEYVVTDADGEPLGLTVEMRLRPSLFGLLKIEVECVRLLQGH